MHKSIDDKVYKEVLALYKAGKGYREIVGLLHLTFKTIKRILDENNIKRRKGGPGRKHTEATPGYKVCRMCKTEKPLEDFGKNINRSGSTSYRPECHKCDSKRSRALTMKNKFGMSMDDYNILLEKQKGVCACCGQPEWYKNKKTGKVVKLAIDHCHTTGKVRQLLCQRCNRVLGLIEENPDVCELVRAYILNHKEG